MQDFEKILDEIEGKKNSASTSPHDAADVKQPPALRGAENSLSSPTDDTTTLTLMYSGHRLRFTWDIKGVIMRKPDWSVQMRGWKKKGWDGFEGAEIVANARTLEIWVKTRRYKDLARLLSEAWSRADMIARHFSTFARVPLIPKEAHHPLGLQGAHLVIESDKYGQARLKLYMKRPALLDNSQLVGWVFDKSHPDKPEATGEQSIEGMTSADWLFLKFAAAWKEQAFLGAEKAKTDEERFASLEREMGLLHASEAKIAEGIAAVLENQRKRRG